ncbi:MAG TPA: hypothetical protein VMB21_02385 [Candidatus Limnocylindria bacterium]|jgi:uncharacterized protein (TIGR03067 family)|nr:hypothetical protein [Candidatus Limnocylindria bacterium]
MKLFLQIITFAGLVAAFIARAGEQPTADRKDKRTASPPASAELRPLQGTWEGVMVGDKSQAKIIVTVTGHSLHFHRDTNFWFETTITLPPGTIPQQLHATIKDCPTPQRDSLGKVVVAIFKIEDGALTLVTGDPEVPPKSFEAAENGGAAFYELRKVRTQKENAPPLLGK